MARPSCCRLLVLTLFFAYFCAPVVVSLVGFLAYETLEPGTCRVEEVSSQKCVVTVLINLKNGNQSLSSEIHTSSARDLKVGDEIDCFYKLRDAEDANELVKVQTHSDRWYKYCHVPSWSMVWLIVNFCFVCPCLQHFYRGCCGAAEQNAKNKATPEAAKDSKASSTAGSGKDPEGVCSSKLSSSLGSKKDYETASSSTMSSSRESRESYETANSSTMKLPV